MAYYAGTTYGGVPVSDGSKEYREYVASGQNVVGSQYVTTVSSKKSSVKLSNGGGGGKVGAIPFYGATADINAAKGILGSLGNYIDTTGWSVEQQMSIPAGSYIVGGEKAGGGVSVNPVGTTRIAGYDLTGTASEILRLATGGVFSGSKQVATVPKTVVPNTVVAPSGTQSISPSINPMGLLQGGAAQTQTGINGTNTSVLSGFTFDNAVAVMGAIVFINFFMGLVSRRR